MEIRYPRNVSDEDSSRIAVFVDVQNVYYTAFNMYQGRMKYEDLLCHVLRRRYLHRATAYLLDAAPEQEGFIERLIEFGYVVKIKQRLVNIRTGKRSSRWEQGIAIDAVAAANSGLVDTIVFVTGDGDFTDAVSYIEMQSVNVEVYGFDDLSPAYDYRVLPDKLLFHREQGGEEEEYDDDDPE